MYMHCHPIDFIFNFFSLITSFLLFFYDNRFFFKCPIGKQISLLLNKIFLSIKHVHLHYEILLRPTSSSPEVEQEKERKKKKMI